MVHKVRSTRAQNQVSFFDRFKAPTSLTNGPPFIEIQGEYILQLIEAQREQGLRTIDAKREAAKAWREHCLALVEKTLLVKTNSWYMGAK